MRLLLERGWEKYRFGHVYLFIESKESSCRYAWTISKWLERKQNMAPMWKKLKISLRKIKKMFESRISAGAIEKLPGCGRNLTQKRSRGHTIWKVMRKYAWKDLADWPTKGLSTSTKSQVHVWTTTTSRKKNWKRLENCPKCPRKRS